MTKSSTISELAAFEKHTACVLDWLRSTWDDPNDVFAATIAPTKDCPGALVAMENDTPIGILSFRRYQAPSETNVELWINAVYVVQSHRRLGIGRKLIRSAVEHSIPEYADRIFVFTDVPALYEPIGWKQIHFSAEFGSYTLLFEPNRILASKGV